MPNEKDKSRIPLCRSRLLQDVTIALGRRSLKSLRQSHRSLTFEVGKDCVEGASVERLDFEARTWGGRLTRVVLWEDALSWMYCREETTNVPGKSAVEIQADLATMSAQGIADLIRKTLVDPVFAEGEWRRRASTQVRENKA